MAYVWLINELFADRGNAPLVILRRLVNVQLAEHNLGFAPQAWFPIKSCQSLKS